MYKCIIILISLRFAFYKCSQRAFVIPAFEPETRMISNNINRGILPLLGYLIIER